MSCLLGIDHAHDTIEILYSSVFLTDLDEKGGKDVISTPPLLFYLGFCEKKWGRGFAIKKKVVILHRESFGALAHLVERNTGSVEVSGSSPLCSTRQENRKVLFFCVASPPPPPHVGGL